jgi:predicted MPP superfamily phosphohydrolase
MFFRLGLVILLLPSLYVYFRLLPLFSTRRHRILFTLFLLCLLAPSLGTEMLSHSTYGDSSNVLLITGYCSLPFLLYVFLSVLLRDILLGMNRLFKFVSADVLKSTRVRKATIWIVLLFPLLVVVNGRLHYSTLVVNRYHIRVPKQSSTMQHIKVALASDLHIKSWTDMGFMKRFVDLVNSEKADLLLLPGDLVEGDRQNEQLLEFEKLFRAIRTTYGVFASMGNHESHGGGTAEDFFHASNIAVLRDTAVVIDSAFTLIGRNDGRADNNRRTIEDLMRTVPRNLPVIVLDHRPTDIERISKTNADMLVSGHTHYGQLWPINHITGFIYDVNWGYKKIRSTHIFVTSGLQLWGPPVRTAGDSEIMMIDVDFVQ